MAQSPSDKKPDLSALLLPARIFVALPSERTLAVLAKAIAEHNDAPAPVLKMPATIRVESRN